MKDISPILKSLGLLDSEVKTYLAALENGPGTVLDLSKSTRLSRQAVYVAIESLTGRGLMSSALRGKKRFYAAEHPDKLLAYAHRREDDLKERIGDLERILPELELQSGGEKPTVRVYEGKEGVRAFLEEVRKSKPKRIEEIADLEAVNLIMGPEELKPMRNELKKIGTKVRGLYSGAPADDNPHGAERHTLAKEYSGFKTDIAIYEDSVGLVTLEGKMFTVLIESKALAKTMRVLFELALKCTKDSKQK